MFRVGCKLKTLVVAVTLMAFSVPSLGQNKTESATFLDVQRMFDARRFEEAKELLTKLQVQGDLAVEKYMWLSRVQLELGAGIAAEAAIVRARDLKADYAVTAVPYAKALLVQGKYNEALEAMRGVSVPKAMQDQAYIVSGDAHFALRDYAKARRDYLLAIDADDSNFQPYLGLSRLQLNAGDVAAAKKLAEQAAAKDSHNTMVQFTLGLISRYLGETNSAEKYFLEAVSLFPNNVMANIELASIRINQNRIPEAEAYLDVVYSASLNQPMAIFLSAVILATQGDYENAELNLLRVQALTENYLPAIYVRGLVAYQLGKYAIAADTLEKVLSVSPDNKTARMALAGTYAKQQRPRAALNILQPLLAGAAHDDAAVLTMAASAAMAAGDVDRGKLLYERVAVLQNTDSAQVILGVETKLAMAQFVTGNPEDAVATISSISGGVGIEIRELGVMASMQIRNEDMIGARSTIEKIIEAGPKRALGFNMMGTLAFKEGDFIAAANSYSQALERNPKYFSALRNRGLAYFRSGDYENAEIDLRNLLSRQPNDARSKAILGKTLLTMGQAEEAVPYFKEAVRELPASIELAADYAQALAEAGQTTRAIEQARAAAKQAADKPALLKRMGLLLLELGQPEAAERPLSRYVAFNPASGEAHLMHGRALLSMGLFTGSTNSFQRARQATEHHQDPAIIEWYLFAAAAKALRQKSALEILGALDVTKRPADVPASVVGDILLHSGKPKEAESAYRQAFFVNQSADLAIGLSKALSAQSQDGKAIALLESFVANHPSDRFARSELGARFEGAGRFEDAAKQYEQILRNGVADSIGAAKLASVYLRLNNSDSIRLVERAFLISPDDPYILDVHGWVMLQAGRDVKKAVTSLEKAVRRVPGNASYKYHLGMAYLAENRRRVALKLLKQAVNLDDNFADVEEARRQISLLSDERK